MKKCEYCHGDIAIRNPTGKCDHLYYPENVNKKLKHYKYYQGSVKLWIFKIAWAFLHDKWDLYLEINFIVFKFRLNAFNGWDHKIKEET